MDYLAGIGEMLVERVMTSKVLRWAMVLVTSLVALVGFGYLADAFPRRELEWISLAVFVVLLVGFWASIFSLIEDARKDGEAVAKRRILEQFALLEEVQPEFQAVLKSTLTDEDFARFLREIHETERAEEARLERHRRSRGVKKRRGAKE